MDAPPFSGSGLTALGGALVTALGAIGVALTALWSSFHKMHQTISATDASVMRNETDQALYLTLKQEMERMRADIIALELKYNELHRSFRVAQKKAVDIYALVGLDVGSECPQTAQIKALAEEIFSI